MITRIDYGVEGIELESMKVIGNKSYTVGEDEVVSISYIEKNRFMVEFENGNYSIVYRPIEVFHSVNRLSTDRSS